MAQTMNCDSCGRVIEEGANRAQVLVYSSDPIADPMVDLCEICGKDVMKDARVQKAKTNVRKKIIQRRAEEVGLTYEDYLDAVDFRPGPKEANGEQLRGDVTEAGSQ